MLSPPETDLIRRDPDLPGLATVLDPEALSAALLIDARPEFVRYKPHILCRATYQAAGQLLEDCAVAVNVFPNDADLPNGAPKGWQFQPVVGRTHLGHSHPNVPAVISA